MSHVLAANRRIPDAAIGGLVLVGAVLAVVRGTRLLPYGALDTIVPIVFPALVATFVYLRFDPDVQTWVPVGLFVWGCVAGFLAMFVGFFVVVDNPAAASGDVTTASLVLDALGRFLAGTIGLSAIYGAAGYTDRLALRFALIIVAPIVQFLVLVPLAFVL